MKPWTISLALCAFLLCAGTAPAAEPLTLRDAIRLALERNLEVRASLLQYRAAGAAIGEARGLYDPRLHLLLDVATSRDALNLAPFATSANRGTRLEFSLLQQLPSGAALTAGVNQRQDDNLRPSTGLDPSWRNELRLTLTQPLLRGYGRMATEEPILLALQGRDAAAATLHEQVTAIVVELHTLFAEIRRSREIVASSRASVGLAEAILRENRAKVEAGLLPPLDVLEAEVGLKTRQRELLDAEQAGRDLLDRLAERLDLREPVEVVAEPFAPLDLTLAEEADLASALARRPDLRRAQAQLESRRLEAATAQRRRLPELDLGASYAQKGFDADYGGSIAQSLERDLPNWAVGLTLNYPLGNRQARGEALRRSYAAEAAQREVERLRELARREVRAAIRQLEVGRLRLEVTGEGVRLADEKLRNLLRRREVGLATTRDVLEGEADLARARTDRAAAEATWAGALAGYLRACGRLLDHEGIRLVEEQDAPGFAVGTPAP